jgi:hypothetical protein
MRVEDAATYTSIGRQTLNKYRMTGGGPPYSKLDKTVVYDRFDLDRWLEERKLDKLIQPPLGY